MISSAVLNGKPSCRITGLSGFPECIRKYLSLPNEATEFHLTHLEWFLSGVTKNKCTASKQMWWQKQLNNRNSALFSIFSTKICGEPVSFTICTELTASCRTIHDKMHQRINTCVLIHTNNHFYLLPTGCWCHLSTQRASRDVWSSMTTVTGSMPTTVYSTTRKVDSFKLAYTMEHR